MSQLKGLKHFYIPDEQSIYLLSHADAKKLKDWVNLCISQLESLGYRDIELLGKGAFGFAFAGSDPSGEARVFKFSRITLPQHVQDRLEEEAFMLSHINHEFVPRFIEYQQIRKQSILVMGLAPGEDLEKVSLKTGPLPPRIIVKIAVQVGELLSNFRQYSENGEIKPIVHGDIKPSNLVWDKATETVGLIDWGSSVFAQTDISGQYVGNNVMDLMSGELHQTNARLGDVYFIGEEQLNGALSSPRFDEQGLASTLYALASGQSCRYGSKVITPSSLGLPKMLANILEYMLSEDPVKRRQGGDYLFNHLHVLKNIVFNKHFKFKRYNNKFINSIVKFFLHILFPEVLNVSEPIKLNNPNNFNISKFGIKIYSQNEEDGIILYILKHIGIRTKKFIEIGSESGMECNTTNLLKYFDWSGMQIEGDKELYSNAKIQFKKNLREKIKNIKLVNSFVTKKNINKIIKKNFKKEVDLLSIDIDGNDFWVWEEINCINPRLVVIEYNSFFGSEISCTIPYNPKFIWDYEKKRSYYGASLKALEKLGRKKKYTLVGVDKNGVNAFFVRNDLAKKIDLKSKKCGDVFVDNKREIRNMGDYTIWQKKVLNDELGDLIKI